MKLCKLKLKNLNSFRKVVEIDFEGEALKDTSLVAITGPTGSGKTTLLDAICVALYGKTPRLSGNASQHPRHLISHGETEGFAEVHFQADGKRYHATWTIRRNSSPRGQLFDASGELITAGVAQEVESILGLDFNAFRRSVMLAQGEFAAFLKAKNEERRRILEATAGIQIYDILRQALLDKVREVQGVYDEIRARLDKIPEASREQITVAETELERLEREARELAAQSQCLQEEKTRETKRREDFEKLQSSEARQRELSAQQPEIDALQVEKDDAERANHLRSEKQTYDTTKSELEKAKEALDAALVEKTEAGNQVKTDQADFDKKDKAYQTASNERDQKIGLYNEAKLNVGRAGNQFAEADKRTPDLANLGNQIDALDSQLAGKYTERTQLQEQIGKAKNFIDENHLPSNRQHRLTEANVLLSQLNSRQQQLETTSASVAQHEKKVGSLKKEVNKLSKTHESLLAKQTDAVDTLRSASKKLTSLQASGTLEEWDVQKQRAIKAQPIAQKYETAENDLTDAEDRLGKLKAERADLDADLEVIGEELTRQAEVCQRAAEAVRHCEATKESVLSAGSVNHFRHSLQPGEPCAVCGATDHPFADIVEPEGAELLQEAEKALADAKADDQAAQQQMLVFKTKQAEIQQNQRNTDTQIDGSSAEIQTLQGEKSKRLARWQEIYPNDDVSSNWIAAQIADADTAIGDLTQAEQARRDASHDYEMVSQQFRTCENSITRETKSLTESEKQLQVARDAVKDLKTDIASIEERFWEFLPDAFHDVPPGDAVDQFKSKIKEVETRENQHRSSQSQLQVLNINIEADQSSLENLRENRDDLQTEIDGYRHEGKSFLDTVREKTGGLETEDEIDDAIDNLNADLQSKEVERDDAQQQLQNSQTLLTQKQTTHEHCEKQHKESAEKLETARDTYFDELSEAGFDSPEAHDIAFRDEARIQALTDQIEAYEDEKQDLALEITELRTRFEETPFDSEALARIETETVEIQTQLQDAQQEIGAQQNEIKSLKDALEKREELGNELRAAHQELERWKTLQQTIPANDLRDFALEIMFRQMGSLANEQLNYLTSERYQLKVETIGDLTVIDRWNANEERPVETLSGGESFLTSLALALALADLSRGRAQLNSLFLDEGFGTLDTETLDTAIAALEGLRMQGRSIFLISHIQELTRRLPVKIEVRKHGNDSSDSAFSSSIHIRG